MWQSQEIKKNLKTRIIGREIYCLDEVGSTQDIAHSLAASGTIEGALIIAQRQTYGRGRFNREWISPDGGLWFSLLLRPDLAPAQTAGLSLLMGLGVTHAIISETNLPTLIKWPNDIWIRGKKVAGILMELIATDVSVKYILLGIGVNVNISSELLPDNATSLEIESGQEILSMTLLIKILEEIEHLYLEFVKTRNLLPFLKELNDFSLLKGKSVQVKMGDNIILGQASLINELGQLLVDLPDGSFETISAGEVIINGHS